ncbi:MAG: transporter substrate-binding domain-containing protein [Synechococcaceae cyanobacterium RM1_1_27]|nr:transporter substrate-binding domain-containing protein [Synechococcaceae cyanobacterium RM1_1_27]
MDEIIDDGILRVAVKDSLPPLGFQDPNGQLVGFEIDIARELARRLLGSVDAVELIPVTNQDRLAALMSDQVDLVIAQMGVTRGRAREVSFSRPYYLDGIGIMVRADSTFQAWADLRDRRVVALAGSEAVQRVTLSLPATQLLTVSSYQDGLDLLTLQAVEAVVADLSVLAGWLRSNPGYRFLDPPLSTSGLAVVTAKGD